MRNLIAVFILIMNLSDVSSAHAAPTVNVTQNQVVLSFPESATFRLEATNSVEIASIVLEYGSQHV